MMGVDLVFCDDKYAPCGWQSATCYSVFSLLLTQSLINVQVFRLSKIQKLIMNAQYTGISVLELHSVLSELCVAV